MELVEILRACRRHRFLLALVVLAAAGGAAAVKLSSHSVQTGSATSQILVDSPQSALADLQQDPAPLATRASVFAQLMTSGAVLQAIAGAAGIHAGDVTAEGPYSGPGQTLDVPTPAAARGAQILATKPAYHLTFVAQTNIPIVTVSVIGPTPASAGRVANAVYPGVSSWLNTLEAGTPTHKRVTIRQLGNAQVGPVNSSSATILAAVAAAGILILGLLAVIGLDAPLARRARLRASGASPVWDRTGAGHDQGEPAIASVSEVADPTKESSSPFASALANTRDRTGTSSTPDVAAASLQVWVLDPAPPEGLRSEPPARAS